MTDVPERCVNNLAPSKLTTLGPQSVEELGVDLQSSAASLYVEAIKALRRPPAAETEPLCLTPGHAPA